MASCSICGVRVKWNAMRRLWVDRSGNANTCHSGERHNGRVYSSTEVNGAVR
jgi:hypothetical protein